MPCITTCVICGKLYEESSEERANEPDRSCQECWRAAKQIVRDDRARRAGRSTARPSRSPAPLSAPATPTHQSKEDAT